MANEWSSEELAAACAEYSRLLDLEAEGLPYVKIDSINRLRRGVLHARTKGSVEMRFQNISHVLDHHDIEFIDGWKPLPNVGAGVQAQIEVHLADVGLIEPPTNGAEAAEPITVLATKMVEAIDVSTLSANDRLHLLAELANRLSSPEEE